MASGQDLGKMQRKKVTLYLYIDTMNLRQKSKKTLGLLVILKVQRLQPEGPAWILADFGSADFS